MSTLNGRVSALQASVDQLNQQIADMKKQNETLYYNKELLLDQLSLSSFQLQLKATADIQYVVDPPSGTTPTIKKLNLNNNSLTTFNTNILLDLEEVGLSNCIR